MHSHFLAAKIYYMVWCSEYTYTACPSPKVSAYLSRLYSNPQYSKITHPVAVLPGQQRRFPLWPVNTLEIQNLKENFLYISGAFYTYHAPSGKLHPAIPVWRQMEETQGEKTQAESTGK